MAISLFVGGKTNIYRKPPAHCKKYKFDTENHVTRRNHTVKVYCIAITETHVPEAYCEK